MTPNVTEALGKENPSEFHEELLSECKADIKASRGVMSQKYSEWDLQDQVYRGERVLDKEDVKQARKDAPTKMVIPNTFAQVMTFTSFLFLLFKQNDTPFELSPSGPEDYGNKWKDCEAILKRDWARSQGSKTLFQFLLDTARFGTAPLQLRWTKQTAKVWVTRPDTQQNFAGVPITAPGTSGYEDFIKFEGNVIDNVSPYRWFPDTSFPLANFEKGAFCGLEEDFTIGELKRLEKDGEVQGIDWIEGPSNDWAKERGSETRMTWDWKMQGWDSSKTGCKVCVTKLRKWIIPKNFLVGPKHPLGDEEFPVLYTIWYANDNRIIKLEPCQEWHQSFSQAVGQFTPDMHRSMTMGLADLIYRMQDVISWFVNSHISSVRRVIQNRLIINPSLVEMTKYDADSGDIFLRKGVGRMDPRMAAMQLEAHDVTAGHMGDVDMIGKMMQVVTGVNENIMGQYNGGRRSAQESRTVTAGAAGRMKMHAHLLWEQGLSKIGKMMLSNSRQSLSSESFFRAIGGDPAANQDRYLAFQGTPEEVICGDDYLGFDATLQSEKGFMAQSLQELLSLILQTNPAAAQALSQNVSASKLVSEMMYLRDGTPIERFAPDQAELQQMEAARQQQQQQEMMAQQASQAQAQQQMQMQAASAQQKMQIDGATGAQKLAQAEAMHQQKLKQQKANGNSGRK